MIVFLFIYVLTFCLALSGILRGNTGKLFLFVVFGLPIYFTALSIAYINGLGAFIPLLQGLKEIIILVALVALLYQRKKEIRLHIIDKLVLAYLIYTAAYVVLPIGGFGFFEKLLALKSLSFFPLVYFTGRLIDIREINFNNYFSFISLVAILAGCVLVVELIRYEHLQTYTGYAEFNKAFFKQESNGNYGLSWTFETPQGLKRFASFYGGPLELGVDTVCTAAVLMTLATRNNNRFRLDRFQLVTLFFTVFAIFMALSRASFASYFLILYVYAHLTEKKQLVKFFHYGALAIVFLILFFLQGDIYDWIINTMDFSDSSSAFHIVQWLDGLNAIASHPLGLGLGMSGRVSIASDSNIGGENQLIIIGVQAGLIAVILYCIIYVYTIITCTKVFKLAKGKMRKPALALFLIKIGIILPLLTANTESYIYLSYLSWLLTGIVVKIAAEELTQPGYSINLQPLTA